MALRLKAVRSERGLTQEDVARVLGVTRSAYANYEKGFRDIPTNLIIELADYYKCTTDELLGSRYYYEAIERNGSERPQVTSRNRVAIGNPYLK